MQDDSETLKSELRRGGGKRYPAELRQRAVQWALKRRAEGRSWSELALELGVALDTVRRWCVGQPPRKSSRRKVVPVQVVDGAPGVAASGISVTAWRASGLSTAQAAELLRALE
jgi:hypothetical protein